MSTQTAGEALENIDPSIRRMIEHYNALPQEEKDRQAQMRIQQEKESVERRMREILTASNVPKRHLLATPNREGEWAAAEGNLSARLGKGFLIALVGIRGSGKTQLAVEMIRKNAADMKGSRYCTAMEFFIEIKAGYKTDGDAEKVILQQFCSRSLLVMDEIGQRSENDWENRLLYELLNHRYNDMKDTLIISNQDVAQLEAALGPSLVSRMRETGGVIECNWESYRK